MKTSHGQLKMAWGKLRGREPDICYLWGEGVEKFDAHLLHGVMMKRYPDAFDESKLLPNFLEELENRGYDIKTIKFSIQKKIES